jgi:hypothetical protein
MSESATMLLAVCLLGVAGFGAAGCVFILSPAPMIGVWFLLCAAMFGWLASRIMRER